MTSKIGIGDGAVTVTGRNKRLTVITILEHFCEDVQRRNGHCHASKSKEKL